MTGAARWRLATSAPAWSAHRTAQPVTALPGREELNVIVRSARSTRVLDALLAILNGAVMVRAGFLADTVSTRRSPMRPV
jgi:hypothetical protein